MSSKEPSIGLIIRQFRMSYGYKQAVVANALGIDQSTYSAMENDSSDWPISRLFKLAEFYGVSVVHMLMYNHSIPIQPVGSNFQQGNNNKYSSENNEKIIELYERIIMLERENAELKASISSKAVQI